MLFSSISQSEIEVDSKQKNHKKYRRTNSTVQIAVPVSPIYWCTSTLSEYMETGRAAREYTPGPLQRMKNILSLNQRAIQIELLQRHITVLIDHNRLMIPIEVAFLIHDLPILV